MTYFNRRKSIIKVWDESKHPREPAGSDKGGEFASGGGKAGGKETFEGYVQRVFDLQGGGKDPSKPIPSTLSPAENARLDAFEADEFPRGTLASLKAGAKPGSPGSALPGMTVGDVLRHKAASPMTASGHRPLSTIAREIRRDWGPKVYFGAKPYLDALSSLSDIKDDYGLDPAKQIVAYFLGNATGWRGPKAREIKAELKKLLK